MGGQDCETSPKVTAIIQVRHKSWNLDNSYVEKKEFKDIKELELIWFNNHRVMEGSGEVLEHILGILSLMWSQKERSA